MLMARKGGLQFVPRVNPAAADWTQTALTKDGNYHALSLTSIVPITAKLVQLYVTLYANTAGTNLLFRPSGYTNGFDVVELKTPSASTSVMLSFLIKPVAGVIDYAVPNASGLGVNIDVSGWFL